MNKLGSSDLQVPAICLGTMTWGTQNSEVEAHEQLDYAVKKRGLTFLDTAEIYPIPPSPDVQGRTESYIGTWLAKNGGRDKLTIATKVSPAGLLRTRNAGRPPKLDKKHIEEAVNGSLKRLQTDYIDLYQVHWPLRTTNFFDVRGFQDVTQEEVTSIHETLVALQSMIDAGKIRHIGVSNETPWGIHEYIRQAELHKLPKIVSIQNQYSLLNRTFEIGLSEICMREDIGLLAYSTLNMGVLTGKYLNGARPEGARFSMTSRNHNRYDPSTEHGQDAVKMYVQLAKDHGLDPATLAIAFVKDRSFTSSVIIGATNLDQLKVCIDAGEIKLNKKLLTEIDQIHADYPDITA